jgi:hypothetical protein
LVADLDRFYLYYLYYNRIDPIKAPALLEAMSTGRVMRLGNVQFGGFNLEEIEIAEDRLLLAMSDQQYQDAAGYDVVETIAGYDGEIRYVLVTPTVQGGL